VRRAPPPVPLSTAWRGGIHDQIPQKALDRRTPHILILEADYTESTSLEPGRARSIVLNGTGNTVNRTVELDDEPMLSTVEIDDEPIDYVLATKLETEHTAVPEQGPRAALSER